MMAEAKPTTPEGVDIEEYLCLLGDIQLKEQALARHSNKLRKAVKKIFDAFGSKDFCRVCGEHVKRHPADHFFVPKIYVSIKVIDSEPFYVDGENEFRLVIEDGGLWIGWFTHSGDYITKPVDDVSRKVIGELVKSGRLIEFFKIVEKQLEETGREYEEIATVAEKLANALV